MLQLPNRTGQAGVYTTGTPDYVDVDSASAAVTGMVTFATKATDDSWADGDTVSVEIRKDDLNYWVGTCAWDATNEYLELGTAEEYIGTLSDSDAVTVIAVPTALTLKAIHRRGEFITEATAARTLSEADNGQILRCTSADAVTITCDDALPVDFHLLIIQEGAGAVSVAIEGTDTLNGATASVPLQGQFYSAYLYQPTEGAWVVLV